MQHSDPDQTPDENEEAHLVVLLASGHRADFFEATHFRIDGETGALTLSDNNGVWVATLAGGFWLQVVPSTTQTQATPPPSQRRAAGSRLVVPA